MLNTTCAALKLADFTPPPFESQTRNEPPALHRTFALFSQ